MEREKWEQVKEIFDAALQRAPLERERFLVENCGGDEELRREVQSLLSSFDGANSFLQKPAVGEIADVIESSDKKLESGKRFGHYQILKLLGAGGMGEVYLAEDTKLDRRVAVKILNEDFARHESNLRRFTREAKAASALNHPNILVIYEIGASGDSHFIVSEYIEGKTLRQIFCQKTLALAEILDISIQIAGALLAAHAAHIVHRDIKPENIIVRPDGYAKVLDFGLAKLVEEKNKSLIGLEDATVKQNETAEGLILGTINYMSPEQAKGERVDERTDIFSLGVLIYEMIAGRTPFAGASVSETLANLMNAEPQPLARFSLNAPAELQRIVTKMLRKNKDERYQTMKGLLADLKDLRRELEFQDKLERTNQPHGEEAKTQILSAANDAPHAPSSVEYVAGGIKNHKLRFAALSILIVAAIGFGLWFFAYRPTNAKQIESIAILPLNNESGSAEVEYLSEGISESLINSLSQLKQLKVVARTTAFAYKSRQSDPREVGRQLGVDAVLAGKVTLLGDTLIVQMDLVSVADGSQIWGERYTRKLADLLSVQKNISHEILARLQPKLSSEGKKQLAEQYPDSSEAYQLYLKGRFFWNRRTEEGIRKGKDYFEQAISEDPEYALAYVGLADSYNVMGFYSFLSPKESFPKAKAAAEKALELNEELAEAHNSLAYATLYYDWNFAAAEKEFLRAIELKPNYPIAHQWYGNLLTAMGRWDEAIQEFERAGELDPLSLVITAVPGWTYYYARQFDRAIEPCQKAIDMDRNFALAHNWLGQVYERKGMYERAISEFKEALSISGDSPETAALLAHVYAVSGSRRQAQVILDNLLELSKQKYVSPYHIATIYAGLGDKDRALKWLDTAYNDRQNLLIFLKHDARLDNLRGDPRFQDLLRRVGFSQ